MSEQELTPAADEVVAAPKPPPPPQPILKRIRLSYARGPELRYISHLEMQTVWERSFRRARLPLAYSQGFNPRPRIHLAAALPLGFLSREEWIDFWMSFDPLAPPPEVDLDALRALMRASVPPGVVIDQIEDVPLSSPALQTLVRAAEYEAAPAQPESQGVTFASMVEAVEALLANAEIMRVRRGKTYDLRALISVLKVLPPTQDAPWTLWMGLSAREGATGRPEEVLDALGMDANTFTVERLRLIMA